jgi:enoyl-CoA hydratase
MPKPVIAAVNGWALGAGFELALICDFVYAAESARFGFPEASIAMTITGGITHVISRLASLAQAKELAFTCRRIDARTALELGLVNKVVPDSQLLPSVRKVAEEIKAQSPVAIALLKKSLQVGAEATLSQAMALETELILAMLATHDAREGITAFREKRRPEFRGR